MKRLIAITLILAMVPAAALSDLPDISDLTYEELVQLKDQINLAMWNSSEWQEVFVPEGVWIVGEDIPAGHWTIRIASERQSFYIYVFDKIDDLEKKPAFGSRLYQEKIASPGYGLSGEVTPESTDFILEEGWYFTCYGPVIFTPYAGKPDLGFQ